MFGNDAVEVRGVLKQTEPAYPTLSRSTPCQPTLPRTTLNQTKPNRPAVLIAGHSLPASSDVH